MIYERNETMKMIGQQPLCDNYLDVLGQIHDIEEAYFSEGKSVELNMMLLDAYLLGVIEGKRKERARKKYYIERFAKQ